MLTRSVSLAHILSAFSSVGNILVIGEVLVQFRSVCVVHFLWLVK